jgi:D-alanyl-lipoteichoic acid acyltransferase DltB (MBOAT superfamily)
LPVQFRWGLLLLASFIFYLLSGPVTVIIPILITIITYLTGIYTDISLNNKLRHFFFYSGIILNIGILVLFKYFNSFLSGTQDSFLSAFIVPLGISYIVFQAISYLIEIFRGNQRAERNLGHFAFYIFFFPKIISGPIEKAEKFIPQISKLSKFDYNRTVNGFKRLLLGLFLKLVIANRLGLYTEAVYSNYQSHSGITLFFTALMFTVQLFADFAGYTELAIGSAQILGYDLTENFRRPFASKSITELWRRWHISLTSWVYEYIFNPLAIGLRNWDKWAVVFSGFITFLIVGVWHGAKITFLFFGFIQGFYLAVEFLTKKHRNKLKLKIPKTIHTIAGMLMTFLLFSLSLIFFKAENIDSAMYIVRKIFTFSGSFYPGTLAYLIYGIAGILILFTKEFSDEFFPGRFKLFNHNRKPVRVIAYCSVILFILLIGVFDGGQFIYFKF